ncbi:MAG: glycosyltransferase [Desulfovibrio sp.]
MKILHLITGLGSGGAEHMLQRLALAMDNHEHCVVSMLSPGPIGKELVDKGVRVESLNMSRGIPSPAALLALRKLILEYNPDILQSWLYHADLLATFAGAISRVGGWKGRLVWNIRCSYMDFSMYSPVTRITVKACAKMSAIPHAVITNSNLAKSFHQEMGYSPKKFEVLPNGFDVNRFTKDESAGSMIREELGISEDDFVIGMAARYDHMKGHRFFLEAAALLNKKWTGSVRFLLCGEGMDEQNQALMELIKRNKVEDSCVLAGSRNDIARVYNCCDLVTLSSLGEGFPNVLGEAMLCEVPCVTTDVGDASIIIGDVGTVVPPANAAALCDGWLTYVEMDCADRQSLGRKARRRIVERYSLPEISARYEKLYESLLG